MLPRSPSLLIWSRAFLVLAITLVLPATVFASEMWNVLFIAADDLRTDLRCYGHEEVLTPRLDELAARGVLFERAYCQQAVCNPSRASLLTGRRPDTLRIWNLANHFRETHPSLVTLPQHFKKHGYHTESVGKVFHNWRQKIQGDPQSWSVPERMHFARHDDDKPQVEGELPKNEATAPRCMRLDVPDSAYFDGRIAELGVQALRRLSKQERPFFLGVGFWKPHLPFNAPKKYWEKYQRDKISPPKNPSAPRGAPAIAMHDSREIMRAAGKDGLSPDEILELRHGYLAGISFLDAQVGRLLDELTALDLNHKTVIVFWSDHGFHLGEQSLWAKTSNFELDARVPLIIAAPDCKAAGERTAALVELLDLYPTLAELCGLPEPAGAEGVSLAPLLDDASASVKPAAYTQHPRPNYYQGEPKAMGVSVRTSGYRYTEWRDFRTGGVLAKELYDHQGDPDETRNVVSESGHADGLEAAERLLLKQFPRRAYVSADAAPSLEPIRYRNPGLTVDLGVGLWAWPMPIDWDQDGDLDLLVSCPDVPYRGLYLFTNPGGSKTPVFSAAKRVGEGVTNLGVSYDDGKPRILAPGFEYRDFLKNGFSERVKIHPKTNVHPNRVRANQWRYVDLDADGALDLAIGVGDWTDYGWDNAYDGVGRWTRGPLRGFVYWLRNEGTTESPRYAEPVKLQADAKTLEVFGMPSPNFADFDGDGDLDLLCGEFLDGFHYFENLGSAKAPRYGASKPLGVKMDLQMIVPTTIDWDGDGDVDIICGDEDGRVAFIENSGKWHDNVPLFRDPVYFRQQADHVKFGALVTPVSVDWDNDGDEDLICGNTAGYVGFIENLDGADPPRFAEPVRLLAGGETLRIQAGESGSIQGPAEAKWGYTTLDVADWDQDGLLDLVLNSIWGKVVWCRNVGKPGSPKLAEPQDVRVAWSGGPPKPAWNWWKPTGTQLATQWRTTPLVRDLNDDGLPDLIMLDHQGYLSFFERTNTDDGLVLKPGRRVFVDASGAPLRLNAGEAGRSGRRKLCMADWDGDGQLDLIVNSTNAEFWRNMGRDGERWVFRNEGAMHSRRLAGHTTSPTVVDWDRDERPDLLLGGEDGRLYFMRNQQIGLKEQVEGALKIESRGVERGELRNGTRAYSNRQYVWYDVPEAFAGRSCLQTAGGAPPTVFVTPQRDVVLQLATAKANRTPEREGWAPVANSVFGYTDGGRTKMQIFEKSVSAGERIAIPQGSWTGGILLLPD